MTRWSLFLQTLSLLHHFLGLYSFLGRAKSALRSDSDSDTGYRNGYGRARRLTLSSGTIQLRRPRVRDTEEQFESRLLQQGYLVSRKRVRRLMRLMGLEAIYRRPNTSKPAPGHRIFPYLLKGVEVNRVDQVWAADITYIPMAKGFLYLVAIMDWTPASAWHSRGRRVRPLLGAEGPGQHGSSQVRGGVSRPELGSPTTGMGQEERGAAAEEANQGDSLNLALLRGGVGGSPG